MPTLADLGEFELIRRLDAVRPRGKDVRLGPGDDAAVLQPDPGRELVVTTDTFVESRHYLPEWCTPALAGRRLAVANLSDMAAMGARPRWALRSSGVSPARDADELVAFETGLAAALEENGAYIVGGNLSSTASGAWFSLTLLGDVEAGRAWSRSGAREGDVILVTGRPGRAGAGYRLVQQLAEGARASRWQELIEAWVKPSSRVSLTNALARGTHVTAAVDVSDGLAADLGHVCEASGLGAILDLGTSPEDAVLQDAARELDCDATDLLFASSDDYELVLAVARESVEETRAIAQNAGVPIAAIGTFGGEPGRIVLRSERGERVIEPRGFDHFDV